MSEFIGSRISLISKSDIKYVGTLHEINSENSTVALENVTSFGTEGRRGKPEEEVPPSDQVYEFIVFRGSDVKDLTIIEQPKEQPKQPQMPNDPAILGSTRPPQHQHQHPPPHGHNQQWGGPPPPQSFSPYGGFNQQQSRFPPPGGPHGFPGAPGAAPGYGPEFGGPNGPGNMSGPPPPPGWFPPPSHGFPQAPGGPGPGPSSFPPQQNQQAAQGRQGGPSPLQENQRPGQKPVAQQTESQPPPLPNNSKPTELSATPAPGKVDTNAPPLPKDSKPDAATTSAPAAPKGNRAPGAATNNARVAVPLAAKPPPQASNIKAPSAAAITQSNSQINQQTQSATQAAAAAVAAAMAKLGPATSRPTGGDNVETLAAKIGELSTNDGGRGAPRGQSRGSASVRGQRGPRRGGPPRHGVEVPTTDFDFESSNAKFNKQDLVKEAIASGSPAGTPHDENGANGLNGAPLSTNDNASAEDDVIIPAATVKSYDKKSSFFDNISSELGDRVAKEKEQTAAGSLQKSSYEFRTEERRRNMETFGESNAFRGRGRGGYGSRGGNRGGYGRGGPRGATGGYRGARGRGGAEGGATFAAEI